MGLGSIGLLSHSNQKQRCYERLSGRDNRNGDLERRAFEGMCIALPHMYMHLCYSVMAGRHVLIVKSTAMAALRRSVFLSS